MSDSPKCHNETLPKARKRHKCCKCRGWIDIGEQYQRFSGIWDDPATFKTCMDCEALRREADKDAHYDELQCFGELYQWVSEEPDARPKFVSIMQKRGANIHPSWLPE